MRRAVTAWVFVAALGGCEAYDRTLYQLYAEGGVRDGGSDARMDAIASLRDVVGPDASVQLDVVEASRADDATDVAHETGTDAMRDSGTDAMDVTRIDAGTDVPRDVPVDRGMDVPVDRGVDVPVDVPCTPHVVINEYSAYDRAGNSYDEFVELYNNASCAASIAGWTVRSRAFAAEPATVVWTASSMLSVPAHGYVVIGGTMYTGTVQSRFTGSTAGGSSAVANTGGLGLFDASGAVRDSVAANVSTGSLIEGTAFGAAVGGGESLQRLPNGTDSNDNAHDFRLSTVVSPGAPN